jgi:hypothetical protein
MTEAYRRHHRSGLGSAITYRHSSLLYRLDVSHCGLQPREGKI